jgi:hypothetical protein
VGLTMKRFDVIKFLGLGVLVILSFDLNQIRKNEQVFFCEDVCEGLIFVLLFEYHSEPCIVNRVVFEFERYAYKAIRFILITNLRQQWG